MNLMSKLWQDEAGVIVSTEIILVLMILVFGIIAGMVALRDQVTQELADTGAMIGNLSQTFSFTGNTNTNGGNVNAITPSSQFVDTLDENDALNNGGTGNPPEGISLHLPAGATGPEA